MRTVQMGRWEWVELSPGYWGLVGVRAEVFRVDKRGWGAKVGGEFVAYFPSRERAMRSAIERVERINLKARRSEAEHVG